MAVPTLVQSQARCWCNPNQTFASHPPLVELRIGVNGSTTPIYLVDIAENGAHPGRDGGGAWNVATWFAKATSPSGRKSWRHTIRKADTGGQFSNDHRVEIGGWDSVAPRIGTDYVAIWSYESTEAWSGQQLVHQHHGGGAHPTAAIFHQGTSLNAWVGFNDAVMAQGFIDGVHALGAVTFIERFRMDPFSATGYYKLSAFYAGAWHSIIDYVGLWGFTTNTDGSTNSPSTPLIDNIGPYRWSANIDDWPAQLVRTCYTQGPFLFTAAVVGAVSNDELRQWFDGVVGNTYTPAPTPAPTPSPAPSPAPASTPPTGYSHSWFPILTDAANTWSASYQVDVPAAPTPTPSPAPAPTPAPANTPLPAPSPPPTIAAAGSLRIPERPGAGPFFSSQR